MGTKVDDDDAKESGKYDDDGDEKENAKDDGRSPKRNLPKPLCLNRR